MSNLTAGLGKVGYDAEGAAMEPFTDPVADDTAPHSSDAGHYDMSARFDSIGHENGETTPGAPFAGYVDAPGAKTTRGTKPARSGYRDPVN